MTIGVYIMPIQAIFQLYRNDRI